MIKNIVRLEFTVMDKVYHFTCDPDSPIEHIKEAIFQIQKYIGQVEDNIKAQMAAQAAVPPPDVEPTPEAKPEIEPTAI
jgi:hypothetical protein